MSKKKKCLPPVSPKLVRKLKNAQNSLELSTFDISNISISILISKMAFVKYLPAATPN